MKFIITILFIALVSCNKKIKVDCSYVLPEPYSFLVTGQLFTNNEMLYVIAGVPNKFNWEKNFYFTGAGWSSDSGLALGCTVSDTCTLKEAFRMFITNHPEMAKGFSVHQIKNPFRDVDYYNNSFRYKVALFDKGERFIASRDSLGNWDYDDPDEALEKLYQIHIQSVSN